MIGFTLHLLAIGQSDSASKSLGKGIYPWYDAAKDGPRSTLGYDWSWVEDWFKGWFDWPKQTRPTAASGWNLNWSDPFELMILGVLVLVIAVLMVLLVEFWRRYRPAPGTEGNEKGSSSYVNRIDGLPAEIQLTTSDPWAEAKRLHERGDLVGAVIALFAHQLLTLDRLRQIRLTPGRTARQLVRSTGDSELKRYATTTLRLFESAFYGHETPSADAMQLLWLDAEAFERRASAELPS